MADSVGALASAIGRGLSAESEINGAIEAVFGERYRASESKDRQIRNAYGLGREGSDGNVPYAGLINPENPTSGPYGGTSLVWFPTNEGVLIGLGIGTRGLSPDEGILTRPGHRRRTSALRRYLSRLGIYAWAKSDPAALGTAVPKVVLDALPGFRAALKRYGSEMYCITPIPINDPSKARAVVAAYLDLYAYERGWSPLVAHQAEVEAFLGELRSELFRSPSASEVNDLLRQRRFVILQGPPGTGKTRLADEVRRQFFRGQGLTIQFHPSVTYEDFVVGLAPDPGSGELRFGVRTGSLLEAAHSAKGGPFLLTIDELNRADLGKVLGEAIYLFEPGEVGGDHARQIRLPHPVNGQNEFQLPDTLFVLGTMNTADRSIANIDLAIRRRFAFVTVPPDRTVVAAQELPEATTAFDRIADVFVEHASDEAFGLMPGHAYFLAPDRDAFRQRVRFEIIPLLDDYLRQGLMGAAGPELQAVRDGLEDSLAQ